MHFDFFFKIVLPEVHFDKKEDDLYLGRSYNKDV